MSGRARARPPGALTALWLCWLTASCAPGAARFPTSDPNAEPAPPRAPGVVVDPVPRLPPAAARGNAADILLVLSAPRDVGRVKQVVARFFRALIVESATDLDLVLADQAFVETGGGRQPARALYRSRFSQLDYLALRGVPVYRERDLEIYAADQTQALEAARAIPNDVSAEQVFVRVRPAVVHAGKIRVLPDELSLFLRPSAASFQIVRIAESTPVP